MVFCILEENHDSIDVSSLDEETVKEKLLRTQDEVEVLKQELEMCERQLDAKYRAIRILQGHVSCNIFFMESAQ